MEIDIYEETGDFAENKDIARDIRKNEIMPALKKGETINKLNPSGLNVMNGKTR